MQQTFANRWKLPARPAVLRAGIALAVLCIFLNLAVSGTTRNTATFYLALAMQFIQMMILRGVIAGIPGMRWIYIAYDLAQIGAVLWLEGLPGDVEATLILLNVPVWVCFLMPASAAWARRACKQNAELAQYGPADLAAALTQRGNDSWQLAFCCTLFLLYHTRSVLPPALGVILACSLAPLAACVVAEVVRAKKLAK